MSQHLTIRDEECLVAYEPRCPKCQYLFAGSGTGALRCPKCSADLLSDSAGRIFPRYSAGGASTTPADPPKTPCPGCRGVGWVADWLQYRKFSLQQKRCPCGMLWDVKIEDNP